jgi:hypothetical protein
LFFVLFYFKFFNPPSKDWTTAYEEKLSDNLLWFPNAKAGLLRLAVMMRHSAMPPLTGNLLGELKTPQFSPSIPFIAGEKMPDLRITQYL